MEHASSRQGDLELRRLMMAGLINREVINAMADSGGVKMRKKRQQKQHLRNSILRGEARYSTAVYESVIAQMLLESYLGCGRGCLCQDDPDSENLC